MDEEICIVRAIERTLDSLTLALTTLINTGAIALDDFADHIRPRILALIQAPKPDNQSGGLNDDETTRAQTRRNVPEDD